MGLAFFPHVAMQCRLDCDGYPSTCWPLPQQSTTVTKNKRICEWTRRKKRIKSRFHHVMELLR
jgi:hypothetical protein